jgi:hypothetical protein
MTDHFEALRAMVRPILEAPLYYHWTVQGFGMLRTYIDGNKVWRLNVWNKALVVPNVSTIHNHPWHFESWIIAGRFANRRYTEEQIGTAYSVATIKTGEGGGVRSETTAVSLRSHGDEMYRPGDHYKQRADEIHESFYSNGCVTLNKRERVGDGEHARVYWPAGLEWVDAEPRAATEEEITTTAGLALYGWEGR